MLPLFLTPVGVKSIMRSRVFGLLLLSLLLHDISLSAQDLDQLRSRATKLWQLRQDTNKLEALNIIEPQTRADYIQWKEAPILSYTITGFEFTGEANRVHVLIKVHSIIPNIGEIDRVVKEEWVFKDGDWFMRAFKEPKLAGPEDAVNPEPPAAPKFQITKNLIDVGRHPQGDQEDGRIAFKAERREIVVVRPLQTVTGLSIGSPTWTSPSEGFIPYQWDMTMLSRDVDQKVALEVTGTSDVRTSVDVQFRAQIDGKIAFKQVPELIDPSRGGDVQIQMQNLMKTPVRIVGVRTQNRVYVVDDDIPTSIEPGKAARLLIHYVGQTEPAAATIGLILEEPFVDSPVVTIPLNIKLSEPAPAPSPTREELDRLRKQAGPIPNLPVK
jgi:hypothetical protein